MFSSFKEHQGNADTGSAAWKRKIISGRYLVVTGNKCCSANIRKMVWFSEESIVFHYTKTTSARQMTMNAQQLNSHCKCYPGAVESLSKTRRKAPGWLT